MIVCENEIIGQTVKFDRNSQSKVNDYNESGKIAVVCTNKSDDFMFLIVTKNGKFYTRYAMYTRLYIEE